MSFENVFVWLFLLQVQKTFFSMRMTSMQMHMKRSPNFPITNNQSKSVMSSTAEYKQMTILTASHSLDRHRKYVWFR